MKKVIIKNKLGQERSSAKMLDPTEWVASCIEKNSWGKPERWVPHKDEMHAEAYDEADVLEEREVVVQEASPKVPEVWNESGELVQAEIPELAAIVRKEVKLKSEYSIEIIDVSAEHALAECLAKRKAEYPSAEEFLNAWFDGGDAALEELKALRLAVKAKHPKPVAGV
jgi:hypothetical protein